MAKYTPDAACFKVAKDAAGGKLTDDEIRQAFQKIFDEREKLKSQGKTTGMSDRLAAIAEDQAQRTQIAAALARRHAALNVLVRDKLTETVNSLIAQGLKPHQALLSIMQGTQRGVEGGRVSVYAQRLAYQGRYYGDMLAQMQRERPQVLPLLGHRSFDNDVVKEMMELKEGGKPGLTKNADAIYVAKTFATYAEMSRVELNKLGASIGKLDGWAGAQTHDDNKMILAGKQAWVDAIRPLLDDARTFPEAQSEAEIRDILEGTYDTITTGIPGKPIVRQEGGRVNPANMAKSLGKERVLHFKDADSVINYRDKFGYGNTASSIIAHQNKAASLASLMEMLGPNPENMMQSMVDRMGRDIKDSTTLTPSQKAKQLAKLRFDGGNIRNSFDIATGLMSRPVNADFAKIASDIRVVQNMAKLGGSVLSAAPADTMTVALSSMFRGGGFWHGMSETLGGILRGRPEGVQKEISYILGEGAEAISGHINAAAVANDAPLGKMAALQEKFFKWTGLTWWDSVIRSVSVRNVAAEMGMRAQTAFKDLPDAYSHLLGLHGIDEDRWNAIRQSAARVDDGRAYITGDRMRELSDSQVQSLAAPDLARIDQTKPNAAELKADAYDRARFDLEMKVRAFAADEAKYGMISTDAASRLTTTLGTRPGTIAGEATRFIMQFKGFPVSFTQRILGRAIYGQRKNASAWEKGANIGALVAGLGAAGYLAMVMKDTLKGYWPPRNPADWKTMLAAMQQGGALGVYGDYLFGQSSRFGNSALETVAGPTIGTASDFINTGLATRDYLAGKLGADKSASPASQWISLLQGNTPFANLFYVKPALDYLVMNNVKDWATPGSVERGIKNRQRDYGQTNLLGGR